MIFEQVFYGRGPQGYAVLADSGCPFEQVSHAAMLSQLHGTPDAESMSRLRPFLFQHCSCGRVYMGCGMVGKKDGLGRGTLFFHVLIGDAEEVRNAGVCAETFFRGGLFVSGQEDHKIEKVEVDVRCLKVESRVSCCALELPAVVMCRSVANDKVLKLIGDAAFRMGWTTFSWNPSGNFEVVGLSAQKSIDSIPATFNVYDEDGKLLRVRSIQSRGTNGTGGGRAEVANDQRGERDLAESKKRFRSAVVKALIVGFVLGALACAVVTRVLGRSELKTISFDEKFRVDEQMFETIFKDFDDKETIEFRSKIKRYFDFVEANFPRKK